ncbi:MAG: P-II family nitrogen regulator [Methanomassiliicoccales archaeon]
MKKIEAIIRKERFALVKEELEKTGIPGLTTYEVKGRGQQRGLEFSHRVGTYRIDLLPKIKIEVVVADSDVDRIISSICRAARTGEIGDGKIFVLPVENAKKIRTGESGEIAIATVSSYTGLEQEKSVPRG